jgi:hypothetical protein
MKINGINYSIKEMIFIVSQSIIGFYLCYRFTCLFLLFLIMKIEFIALLPFILILDVLTNMIIKTINDIVTLRFVEKSLDKTRSGTIIKGTFINNLMNEIAKYELFKKGNAYGKKTIEFINSGNPNSICYVSYPIFDWKSIVLLPSYTNLSNKKEKVYITHEAVHCISDDLTMINEINIKIYSILVFGISIIVCSNVLCCIAIFVLILLIVFSQNQKDYYSEMLANNYAIEILESINSGLSKREMARILKKPIEMEVKYLKKRGIFQLIKRIKLELEIEYLELVEKREILINFSSPVNVFTMILLTVIILLLVFFGEYDLIKNIHFQWMYLMHISFIIFSISLVFLAIQRKEYVKKCSIQEIIGMMS